MDSQTEKKVNEALVAVNADSWKEPWKQHATNLASALEEAEEKVWTLKKALKWYADSNNWREDEWGLPSVVESPEYGIPGTIACSALDKVSHQQGDYSQEGNEDRKRMTMALRGNALQSSNDGMYLAGALDAAAFLEYADDEEISNAVEYYQRSNQKVNGGE